MTDIKNRVYKVIRNRCPGEKFNSKTRIVEDLAMDSLSILELIMDLGDEFDMNIPDNVIDNVKTVGDIHRMLEETAMELAA